VRVVDQRKNEGWKADTEASVRGKEVERRRVEVEESEGETRRRVSLGGGEEGPRIETDGRKWESRHQGLFLNMMETGVDCVNLVCPGATASEKATCRKIPCAGQPNVIRSLRPRESHSRKT